MTAPLATAESLVSSSDAAFAETFGIPLPAATEPVVEAALPDTPDTPEAAVAEEILADAPAVAETPAAEPRKQITTFTVSDTEGELETPELLIEYKANGETLKESLDKVVRRAQMGGYNEALVKEKDGLKITNGQLQTDLSAREELIASREAQIERLLTDDDFLVKARDAFADYNDPSARATRAERNLTDRNAQDAQKAQAAQMVDFVGTRLVPVYEELATKHPNVSPDEIWGRFARLTAPLQVRGEIPRDKWAQVEKLLTEDIGPWVAQLHEHRATTARVASKETDTTVRKAQEDTTRAKNTLARAVKPVGGSPTPPKAKPIVSVDDAVADIIAGIGTGR